MPNDIIYFRILEYLNIDDKLKIFEILGNNLAQSTLIIYKYIMSPIFSHNEFLTLCNYDIYAKNGCIKLLKCMTHLLPNIELSESTCANASLGGHLEILKWLRQQEPPCPWSELTCANASLGGHLEVLKWLRQQEPPCPWSELTCANASLGGHLEVLKWLRQQEPPCPWYRQHILLNYPINEQIKKWIKTQKDDNDDRYVSFFDDFTNLIYLLMFVIILTNIVYFVAISICIYYVLRIVWLII